MRKDITYISGVPVEKAIQIVENCFFQEEETELTERVVRNAEEFREAYLTMLPYRRFEECLDRFHAAAGRERFSYEGRCAVCNCKQPFIVDYRFAVEEEGRKIPNWRERLVCPNCGCNSRQRFMIQKIFEEYRPGKKILLYEQNSEVYRKVIRELDNVRGFEYIGESAQPHPECDGIIFEDISALNYEDEEFDLLVSNDVFEHTTDYQGAFKEAWRVLKPGGKLLFTVPFNGNDDQTEKRVEMGENGKICTAQEWYHTSPIPGGEPLLVCQIFGWDILDLMKECGFCNACGKVYYGIKDGYLGYLPLYFEACK